MIDPTTRHIRAPDPKALQVRRIRLRWGVGAAQARLIADLRYEGGAAQ